MRNLIQELENKVTKSIQDLIHKIVTKVNEKISKVVKKLKTWKNSPKKLRCWKKNSQIEILEMKETVSK